MIKSKHESAAESTSHRGKGPATQDTEKRVTVQTCGDLPTIGPIVEGQPSTVFPLQTVSVPSNVNSYKNGYPIFLRNRDRGHKREL